MSSCEDKSGAVGRSVSEKRWIKGRLMMKHYIYLVAMLILTLVSASQAETEAVRRMLGRGEGSRRLRKHGCFRSETARVCELTLPKFVDGKYDLHVRLYHRDGKFYHGYALLPQRDTCHTASILRRPRPSSSFMPMTRS